MHLRRFVLSLLVVAACTAAPSPPEARDAAELAAIYAVVIDSLREAVSPVQVERRYAIEHGSADDRRRTRESVISQDSRYTLELFASLDSAKESEQALAVAVATKRFVALVDSLVWPTQARSPPTIGLSRVGFSRDHSLAIVSGWIFCGGRCGHTSYFLLGRAPDGRWQIVHQVVTVVS